RRSRWRTVIFDEPLVLTRRLPVTIDIDRDELYASRRLAEPTGSRTGERCFPRLGVGEQLRKLCDAGQVDLPDTLFTPLPELAPIRVLDVPVSGDGSVEDRSIRRVHDADQVVRVNGTEQLVARGEVDRAA